MKNQDEQDPLADAPEAVMPQERADREGGHGLSRLPRTRTLRELNSLPLPLPVGDHKALESGFDDPAPLDKALQDAVKEGRKRGYPNLDFKLPPGKYLPLAPLDEILPECGRATKGVRLTPPEAIPFGADGGRIEHTPSTGPQVYNVRPRGAAVGIDMVPVSMGEDRPRPKASVSNRLGMILGATLACLLLVLGILLLLTAIMGMIHLLIFITPNL